MSKQQRQSTTETDMQNLATLIMQNIEEGDGGDDTFDVDEHVDVNPAPVAKAGAKRKAAAADHDEATIEAKKAAASEKRRETAARKKAAKAAEAAADAAAAEGAVDDDEEAAAAPPPAKKARAPAKKAGAAAAAEAPKQRGRPKGSGAAAAAAAAAAAPANGAAGGARRKTRKPRGEMYAKSIVAKQNDPHLSFMQNASIKRVIRIAITKFLENRSARGFKKIDRIFVEKEAYRVFSNFCQQRVLGAAARTVCVSAIANHSTTMASDASHGILLYKAPDPLNRTPEEEREFNNNIGRGRSVVVSNKVYEILNRARYGSADGEGEGEGEGEADGIADELANELAESNAANDDLDVDVDDLLDGEAAAPMVGDGDEEDEDI